MLINGSKLTHTLGKRRRRRSELIFCLLIYDHWQGKRRWRRILCSLLSLNSKCLSLSLFAWEVCNLEWDLKLNDKSLMNISVDNN